MPIMLSISRCNGIDGLYSTAIEVHVLDGKRSLRKWLTARQATTVLETKNGQKLLHGTWIDMHDAPVTFNARKYYMLVEHRGNMWALAAYTPQAFKHATASHINKLVELGFPVPVLQQA